MIEANKNPPAILESREVFQGRVFSVTTDTIQEDEKTYVRDVVHHPGSAVIVPVFDDGTVAIRPPVSSSCASLPAGGAGGHAEQRRKA